MKDEYKKWIDQRYTPGYCCVNATIEMVKKFPELRRVKGNCGGCDHY